MRLLHTVASALFLCLIILVLTLRSVNSDDPQTQEPRIAAANDPQYEAIVTPVETASRAIDTDTDNQESAAKPNRSRDDEIGANVESVDNPEPRFSIFSRGPRQFDSESIDPEWSGGMEAELYAQISRIPGFSATTLNAECRTSVCRLVAGYPPGTNAITTFQSQLLPMVKALGEASISADSTVPEQVDTPSATIFLMFNRERDTSEAE
jgi:hypothetical protein